MNEHIDILRALLLQRHSCEQRSYRQALGLLWFVCLVFYFTTYARYPVSLTRLATIFSVTTNRLFPL